MSKQQYISLSIVALVLVGLCLLAGLLGIRALPGRYAYYLPEPLQALRHNPHPDTLPTPLPHTPIPTSQPTGRPTNQPTTPPTNYPTDEPSAEPTSTLTPTPSPTPPLTCSLPGLRHEHQGWNNCGPTTLGMALSYWGRNETQYDVAPVLKPDPEDKNVSLWEMEAYTRDLGLDAIVRAGGSLERLKALLRAGFPVIAETWYVRDAGDSSSRSDQLGHYRLVIGYDDATQEFLTYDSLHGPDVVIGYQEMDELWRVFNRIYLVVYPADRWEEVAAALGPDVDSQGMYERALETARFEVANPPTSCVAYADCDDWVTFSWFSMGTSLTSLGRHAEAAAAYDEARRLGLHFRMLWYQFGPYESYYAVGRYDDVIALTSATLATTSNLEESYYWRGMARWAQEDIDGARSDLNTALHYHQDWLPATEALRKLDGE
jgi:tetratricopeptide (TPR) repeat protein